MRTTRTCGDLPINPASLGQRAKRAGFGRVTLLAGFGLLGLPGGALAQSATSLPPVSVEGKALEEAGPGGVDIDAATIEQRNAADIKDLLTGEAGVAVGGPTPITQKVYIQGLESTNLNVQVDGARQVESTWHHISTSVVDPGMLKAVRIETGVAPADAGPGALGGSIAYETRDARDLLQSAERFGGFGKLSYDSNAEGFTESLAVAGQHAGFEALAYGSNAGGGNYKDGHGDTVTGTAPEMLSGLAKFAYTAGEGHRFELSASHLEDVGVRPARPNFASLNNALGRRLNTIEYYENSLTASYRNEAPTAHFDPELSIAYNKTQLTAFKVTAGPVTSDLGSDIASFNGKAANTFSIGGGRLTAGLDFYHDEATGSYQRKPATPTLGAENTEIATDIGFFAQWRLPVTSDLRVSFGGRGDQQWFEGLEGSSFSNFGLSGNANAEYDLLPWLTAFAGAGTTFGGIPIGETAIYDFSGVWNYAGLEPSRSRNYKAGLTTAHGPFTAEATVFYNKISDAHDLTAVIRATTQDLVSRGGTLAATYSYAAGDYGAGFLRGIFTRTIVRLDGSIPVSTAASYYGVLMGDAFTVEAAHAFRDIGLRLGTSNEFVLRNDESSIASQPGYVVLNLYGEWHPPVFPDLSLRLDVRNLLDKAYTDRATTGFDSALTNPYHEPGRTFLLSARMAF